MSNSRKIHTCLGMALVTAFTLLAGLASADFKLACTISGDTPTGRRWAYLLVSDNGLRCCRRLDAARAGEAAPPSVAHCHSLAKQLGCHGCDMDMD